MNIYVLTLKEFSPECLCLTYIFGVFTDETKALQGLEDAKKHLIKKEQIDELKIKKLDESIGYILEEDLILSLDEIEIDKMLGEDFI
jgi:hypothetical protein